MRIDAQAVDRMLKQTFRERNTCMKNKLRKEQPKAYMNALRIQNKYISTDKTIILTGITKLSMADLRPLLLSELHIHHVAATQKLDLIGQWDIITNKAHQTRKTTNLAGNNPH
jgi:hypothetical protein